MVFKDYYAILELKTNKVSTEEIKAAYREQAKKYHPDANVGYNQNTEERFKDINEAYRILSNPKEKRKYDRNWNIYVGRKKNKEELGNNSQASDSIFDEVFNMFFGETKQESEEQIKQPRKKKTPVKGENVETQITITLEEAFFGRGKKISLRTIDGKMKTFTITVPAGIRDNEKIRLIGQGKPGQNGGKNGDLFIKINIEKHVNLKLQGNDIYTDLLITPWEAALGTRVKINGIDEELKIYIPQGTQSGDKIRIQSKGYKDGKGGRGDLVAEVKIMVPKILTAKEKELFELLKKESKFNPRKF